VNSEEQNIAAAREFIERGFNRGDLSVVDEHAAADGVDHQEPPGTDYRAHLKQAITMIRTAFPDLHFEIHEIIADGEYVAFRSTMTGTHRGPLNLMPGRSIPPTGRKVTVPHLHLVRMVDGQSKDLWHQWDIPGMMRQLDAMPEPHGAAPAR
jgi:predicted ester cyclase